MLACSYGSLGTISSTNIFGAIVEDENQDYLPREESNCLYLTLDGRQEKDIEIDCNHLPGDSMIKDSTTRRILLTEK